MGKRPALRSRIHVGTSGWTYDDWSGSFYPESVKGSDRLAYYTTQFDTVELNASFYRVPTQPMIRAWNARLRESFHLAVKGTRLVTHVRRIADCAGELAFFFERVRQIQAARVVLWQLPPSLRADSERLRRFLAGLPEHVRHAVEFRHPSWWDESTARVLREHGAAFVAVSHPRLPAEILPTADFLYVRFHGLGKRLYDYDYSDGELRDWAERLRPALRGRELYAYFNNDWRAQAPRNAVRFRDMLEA